MPEILALAGLVIATVLYGLLVRRRSLIRFGVDSMRKALSASNEIALNRITAGLRPSKAPAAGTGDWRDGITVTDRRSGQERRTWYDRRRGRGRRAGGDRRRGAASS